MNNCSIRTQTHQLTPSHNTKLECEKLRRTAFQSWIYTSMMMMMMILMLIMLCLSITILKQKRNHENCIVIHGNDFNLKILDKLMFYLDFYSVFRPAPFSFRCYTSLEMLQSPFSISLSYHNLTFHVHLFKKHDRKSYGMRRLCSIYRS